jgi:DNA uptake protein ComE-like DNA-binding protein
MPKIKTLIFLGVAGGVVAAVRKRASDEQLQQAASKASDLADRAKQAAPEPIQQAVDKAVETVTDAVSSATESAGGEGDRDATRRYAAPAEAGSQPPETAGGAPSDEPQPTQAHSVAAETAAEDPSLDATRAHDLPKDVKMPDVSDADPAVQEAEAAAAADAAAIGENADESKP